ncbi:hypothetical protein [Thermoplasma volcanium]|nr:hypothetical protein [Thermoplasma volcanium]
MAVPKPWSDANGLSQYMDVNVEIASDGSLKISKPEVSNDRNIVGTH